VVTSKAAFHAARATLSQGRALSLRRDFDLRVNARRMLNPADTGFQAKSNGYGIAHREKAFEF
jgi:hypothetical protein